MFVHGLNIKNQSLKYYFRNDIIRMGTFDLINLDSKLSIVIMLETVFKTHTKVQDRISANEIKVILINSTFITERIMSIYTRVFIVSNILIQCPTAQMARRISSENHKFYECNHPFQRNTEYSLQTGSLKVSKPNDAEIIQLSTANLLKVEYPPSCIRCPLGAKCADVIQALPEY